MVQVAAGISYGKAQLAGQILDIVNDKSDPFPELGYHP